MPKSGTSERIEFTKSINGLVSKQDAFLKAIETLQSFSEESLRNLDLEIDNRKLELKTLEDEYKKKDTDQRIEIDQSLKEYKYNQALTYLKERNEIAVDKSEYNVLKGRVAELEAGFEDRLSEAISKEKGRGEAALKAAINNSNLTHKAEIAEINAQSKQQKTEIQNLLNIIETLKLEIAEQRQLTKQVDEASKSGAITQSFGK